jgi:hypothetical protein
MGGKSKLYMRHENANGKCSFGPGFLCVPINSFAGGTVAGGQSMLSINGESGLYLLWINVGVSGGVLFGSGSGSKSKASNVVVSSMLGGKNFGSVQGHSSRALLLRCPLQP